MNHLKNLSKFICLWVLISSPQIADTDIFDAIEMVKPRYKNRVTPDYPKEAQQAQKEGTVILSAMIDVNGIPTDIVALTELGFGFEDAAIKALKKTTFHPATRAGKPVNIQVEIPYHFELDFRYPNMRLIPAGEFLMGSSNGDSDEKPVHTVYVDAFYMDIYEVTNAEYKKFVDSNPQWQKGHLPRAFHDGDYLKHWNDNNYPSGEGNYPVVYVNWYAAVAYAEWVDKRLPTEAEWEKAARGKLIGNKYPRGDIINASQANYNRNIGKTTPVGTYLGNDYGLYDMVGNVQEWCLDKYDSGFYANSTPVSPISGANSISEIVNNPRKTTHFRVLRGGSWNSDVWEARSANRSRLSPTITSSDVGFRCVRTGTILIQE